MGFSVLALFWIGFLQSIADICRFFEGTYTAEFADKPEPTPRYNYNQMLYRLDLDDPALGAAR